VNTTKNSTLAICAGLISSTLVGLVIGVGIGASDSETESRLLEQLTSIVETQRRIQGEIARLVTVDGVVAEEPPTRESTAQDSMAQGLLSEVRRLGESLETLRQLVTEVSSKVELTGEEVAVAWDEATRRGPVSSTTDDFVNLPLGTTYATVLRRFGLPASVSGNLMKGIEVRYYDPRRHSEDWKQQFVLSFTTGVLTGKDLLDLD
jgi:hypothetical protein